MKIAFFELEGWEEPAIKAQFADHELFLSGEKLNELTLPLLHQDSGGQAPRTDFDVISAFVDSPITEKLIAAFPNLKLVATRSTGYDHIDLAACAARNVSVASVPGYGDNTVAEFAFSLILNLTRKTYQGIDQIKETGSFALAGLRGTDIKGKTIGVIGTGRIGREVIQIAKGFGMQVIAFDPYPDAAFAAMMQFEYKPLEDLLAGADVITIHCPLIDTTRHLINEKNIGLIKKGAYLVNTARGGIVSTDALVTALRSGILGGAALDVLEEEGESKDELAFLGKGHPREEELKTLLENHVLMKMPNVLITPHMAFDSQEALGRILDITLSNIKGFVDGKPQNIVKT
jgi:D-lactate dehydrogenase